MVSTADLAGLDLTRVPQELAGQIPRRDTPWPRGTCLPAIYTPDGKQAICFGSIEELSARLPELCAMIPVNSARTLWVVSAIS